jgi:hypothetical protein
MTNNKENKVDEETSIARSLDELIEMKKNENSALKKIFESLTKPDKKKTINK